MKKLLLFLVVSVFMSVNALARDVITRDVTKLPQTAQAMIKKHFPKSKVSYIKLDKEIFEYSKYEAILEDGVQIDFNSKGEWIEVDCKLAPVPAALIPAPIQNYLKANFPDAIVEKIEKKRRGGYEVDLKNDFSVKFDAQGNFLTLDD